jgi:hypothetical protein
MITEKKLTPRSSPSFQKFVQTTFPNLFNAVGCRTGSRIMDDTILAVNPGHINLSRLLTPGSGQIRLR